MTRVLRIPHSTNVERVALALAHKSVAVDWVDVPAGDRSAVVEASGQELVPVLIADHGEVVADSMRIVDWIEKRRPDPPLWPAHRAAHAEVDVFVEWFDRVWKVAPNAIAAELAAPEPDRRAIDAHSEDRRRGHLRVPVPEVRGVRAGRRRRRPVPPGAPRAPADRRILPPPGGLDRPRAAPSARLSDFFCSF